MGGTLDNGIYLPDQGERNCYNGLKNNWDTLDNLIETVQALSSAGLTREIVNSLPTENIKTNVIYMLRNSQQSGDLYDEYMYINNAWEPIGTSATEMDNYYTKSETNDLPAVKSGITASKVTGYDSHVANTEVHITAAERSTWNGKQNALDTDQTAAVNSGVNATKVTEYDTHVADTVVHVTASDKTAWNAKQDGLSQAQLNAVNSGVTSAKVTGYDTHVGDTSAHVSSSDRTAWNGKQDALSQTQLDNIAAVPDKANSADLATVATTGDYSDLLNAPTIPTVNNATLTIQKNGADVATFTANASSNVTANLVIPVNTSDLNNDAGFLTQHNPVDNELSATSENALQNKVVKSELDGKAPLVHTHAASDVTSGTFNIARIPNLDASKITSGTIDIARLPKGALERLVKVANQAARYALTTDDVQLGDTVQQLDTGVMYVVTDETKLDSADGYTEFTAGAASSVPWTGVTGKPSDYPPSSHTHTKSQITDFPVLATVATSGSYNDLNNIPGSFTPSSHTHGNVTNDGKLPTASRALISDSSKNITVSSVTDTELGYLSGVTSSVQTQLNGKAASTHVHGNITNDGKVGTTANVPLITGTGGVVQAGAFGNAANTFCEGNDSRLSDARTPVAHTHTKSDVTDLLNSNFIPSANNSYDLGSASKQWLNTYSKGYYYNGVAWGLDKQNEWTNFNIFNGYRLQIKHTSQEIGVIPASNQWNGFNFVDKNRSPTLTFEHAFMGSGETRFKISMVDNYATHNSDSTVFIEFLRLYTSPDGGAFVIGADARPLINNTYNLGTSTNKWKTLNGIDPGALSLPDTLGTSGTENVNYFNVIGYLNNTGTLATIPSTATYDGWLYINAKDGVDSYIIIDDSPSNFGTSVYGNNGLGSQSIGLLCLICPIRAGHTYNVRIKSAGIVSARIYPAQGNV